MIHRMLTALDRRDMRKRGGSYLNTLSVYGTYRCFHRSRYLRLHCLRQWTWQYRCARHQDDP